MNHEEQLRRIEEDFPLVEIIAQGDGWWLQLAEITLPPGWTPPVSRIAVEISAGFPEVKPDGFWIEPGLQAPPGFPPAPAGGEARHGATWAKVCYQVQAWDPQRETYWRYVKAMLRYFVEAT